VGARAADRGPRPERPWADGSGRVHPHTAREGPRLLLPWRRGRCRGGEHAAAEVYEGTVSGDWGATETHGAWHIAAGHGVRWSPGHFKHHGVVVATSRRGRHGRGHRRILCCRDSGGHCRKGGLGRVASGIPSSLGDFRGRRGRRGRRLARGSRCLTGLKAHRIRLRHRIACTRGR